MDGSMSATGQIQEVGMGLREGIKLKEVNKQVPVSCHLFLSFLLVLVCPCMLTMALCTLMCVYSRILVEVLLCRYLGIYSCIYI